jgi:hypothetical protein
MKCQDSTGGAAEILISDLFDPEDLASYDSFVQSPESMIESPDGYLLVSIEGEEEEPSSAPSVGEDDEEDGGATAALHYHSLSVMTFALIAYTFLMA